MKTLILLFIPVLVLFGQKPAPCKQTAQRLAKSSLLQYKKLDVNNISCTLSSDGLFADYRATYSAGLEWPKGTGKTAVFSAGIWLAGIHRPTQQVRVSNMDYNLSLIHI